ncbi:uncharacterized protein RHTO_07069 [Rhodotorula toruloides NP11]|uniref:Uncharacterized protein n=1 Tax=Rhodotorula toruloides (strain NP11) TaxID=1130832 RepID=M7WJQ3_RHOT1|nr:uncharacterized protein RHTO_07069 [Rhodotorula toruloides NP11]EMS18075.1 hypothetical protein RHTO_07069 [Rhodotorula toruloides NP11]
MGLARFDLKQESLSLVVDGVPRVEASEEEVVEALEKRIGEVGAVRSVRALSLRRPGAPFGSYMVVLWNNKHVSDFLGNEGRLWLAPTVCARCERARGKKEMTHREEAGTAAAGAAEGAKDALVGARSMEKGPAGGHKSKKREKSEEKEKKDEPARTKLAKSGDGSLATSPSLGGTGRNSPITTITTSSTPANPFEPVLPPELANFSIERSPDADFGAQVDEIADSAGAKGQQVSPPSSEYAAPLLRAPAKSDGIEARVSEDSSLSADPRNAPALPSLRAPSTETHRIDSTPNGASAPSATVAPCEKDRVDNVEAGRGKRTIPAGAMRQQVSHPQVEYAPPALHAPAKSDGVETRVSKEPSTFAETRDAPHLPLLCAPSNNPYRTDLTPSTGASAPSTSDTLLVAESPLSPTLAARRQSPLPFLESETTSGIWTHVPTPLADRPTQYRAMPIINFESMASEADKSWAVETEEAFPMTRSESKEERREPEVEGGEVDGWKKVEKSRKGKETATRATSTAKGEQGKKKGAKGKVLSRARRVAVLAPKKELRTKESQSRPESPDPLDLLSPSQ